MRKNLFWLAFVVGAALVQTTWLEVVRVEGVLPDLVLVLVVYFAIAESEERAMFTGAVGGILQDVASDTTLGHHVLCNVVVAYAVGRLATRLITEHAAVKAGLVLLGSLAQGILFAGIRYVQQPEIGVLKTILTSAVPTAFYTSLVTPLVFFVLERCFRSSMTVQAGAD